MATDDVYFDYLKNAHDSWNPIPDNVAQFGVGYGLYYNFVHFYMNYTGSPKSILNFKYRYLGGFGYSFKAQIYGALGLTVALLIDLMWPPHIERRDDNNGDET